jgi:hypothetical protein
MATASRIDVVRRLLEDKPAFHLQGEARWDALPATLRWIHETVEAGDSTIETGVGASTVVFASCGARHTAISPDPTEHQRVQDYCERIGIDHSQVSFMAGLSDDVLPTTLTRDRTLDAAFIDGAHSFPFPEVDWYYITRSMKVGGKLLLDDVPIPAVAPVFRHMRLEPNWRLDGIFDNRSAAFTLLAPPAPESWVDQPFNNHYPDLSFVSLPRRMRLQIDYTAGKVRGGLAQRYPGLRRLAKRRP